MDQTNSNVAVNTDYLPLENFINWFMSMPFNWLAPVVNEFYDYGKFVSIVLYRKDQFQVELFLGLPHTTLAEMHTHPNVDSYEMGLCGKINFTCNGERGTDYKETIPLMQRTFSKVFANDKHGAEPEGGIAFLSFQYWKNGVKPTSVGHDWQDESEIKRDFKKDVEERGLMNAR